MQRERYVWRGDDVHPCEELAQRLRCQSPVKGHAPRQFRKRPIVCSEASNDMQSRLGNGGGEAPARLDKSRIAFVASLRHVFFGDETDVECRFAVTKPNARTEAVRKIQRIEDAAIDKRPRHLRMACREIIGRSLLRNDDMLETRRRAHARELVVTRRFIDAEAATWIQRQHKWYLPLLEIG